jgi:bacteriorhodopsin
MGVATLCYGILDVLAKVVFSFMMLSLRPDVETHKHLTDEMEHRQKKGEGPTHQEDEGASYTVTGDFKGDGPDT